MATKTNRFKNEEEEIKAEAPREKESIPKEKVKNHTVKNNTVEGFSIRAFLKDERTHKILGIILMLTGLYLFVAFASFIFTWQEDYSYVTSSWLDFLRNNDAQAENWLGKLGAILSHIFIHNWFGISSFVLAFLLFNTGFKILFEFPLVSLKKSYNYGFFILIYLSVLLGYAINIRFLGGAFGYYSSIWLNGVIGKAGTGLLLFFSFLGFLVVAYNFSFADGLRKLAEKAKKSQEDDEVIDSVDSQAISNTSVAAAVVAASATNVNAKNVYKASETYEDIVAEEDIDSKELDEALNFTVINKDEPELIEEPFPTIENNTIVEEKTLELLEITNEVEEEPAEEELEEEDELDDDEDFDEDEDDDLDDEDLEMMEEYEEAEESAVTDDKNIAIDEVPLAVEEVSKASQIIDPEDVNQRIEALGPYDPTLDLARYKLPSIDLLEERGSNKIQVDREELEENKNRIVETLGHYNIEIDKIKATIGPTITLYEIVPKAGVRISKIKNLEDDIALSLAALGIRIIAPIPGKGTIGIEVPNQKPDVVSMRSVIASEKFQNNDMDLPIALGKTISNEVFIFDLAKMPHLLMAGATGQGKSVGLNAVLVSLLYKKHPAQIKFVLVDPKKVELTLFKTIERHFLAKLPGEGDAIITDNKKVINTLNSLCIEMDQRYELLKNAQVRNIKEYNVKFIERRLNPQNGHRYLPYIVLVVDEFADLIMTAGKEVEMPIARLAQLARAIGIHLIIATQRPSVNIITGTIKANFPGRIAFRVTSKIDSRTILDAGGADQLIGRGDMLLSTGSDLIRIQCAFVDTPEVEKITDYIGAQQGYADAFLLPEYIDEKGEGTTDMSQSDLDPLIEEAARIVVQSQQGSASMLQRKLKLGYNRAGRIVDQLEGLGIIGPFEGSRAREVRIMDEMHLEEILSKLKQ